MALFGGSKSSTKNESTQVGVETEGDVTQIVASGSTVNYTEEFPESVANFASGILGLTGDVLSAQRESTEAALDTLGTIAAREKTPLTEWLPFIAVGATAAVALAFFNR